MQSIVLMVLSSHGLKSPDPHQLSLPQPNGQFERYSRLSTARGAVPTVRAEPHPTAITVERLSRSHRLVTVLNILRGATRELELAHQVYSDARRWLGHVGPLRTLRARVMACAAMAEQLAVRL